MLEGRQYEIYHENEPSDAFGEFQSFLDLWRSKYSNGTRPSWSDFQFEDFDGWYGQLSLFRFESASSINTVLWGTKLTNWWGVDLTNRNLMDEWNETASYWADGEGVYVRNLVENPGIGRWMGSLDHVGRGFVVIEALDVLLEKDGEITHLLSAYINRGEDWTGTPRAAPREIL